jgi:hypothetical protein
VSVHFFVVLEEGEEDCELGGGVVMAGGRESTKFNRRHLTDTAFTLLMQALTRRPSLTSVQRDANSSEDVVAESREDSRSKGDLVCSNICDLFCLCMSFLLHYTRLHVFHLCEDRVNT